jgi:hypothetical protein
MELELTAVVDSYGAMLLLIHQASFFFFFFFHFLMCCQLTSLRYYEVAEAKKQTHFY